MSRKGASSIAESAQAQQKLVSDGIDQFELPRSLVTRIARAALPENAKLQKDTVLSLVKGSTVFINYLAATAHDVAHSKQHKSISASDVLKALEIIEFGDLVAPLQAELQTYRDNNKGKKGGISTSVGPISVPSKLRAKGKERAGPSEAVSAPLPPPPTASVDMPAIHAGEVDEEMVDAARTRGMENVEGPEDVELDEEEPDEEEEGEAEDEDEDLTDDVGEEDIEMGGLQEPDHQSDQDEGNAEERQNVE